MSAIKRTQATPQAAPGTTAPAFPLDLPIPDLGGLTIRQAGMAFGAIAAGADTIASACARYSVDYPEGPPGEALDVIQQLAEKIGFMADAATGFDCVGGWGAWFCGPQFGGDPLANRMAAAASD